MPQLTCPNCGEDDNLSGERDADAIVITCGACAASWDRDTTLRCGLCGSTELAYTPKPLWTSGRGEQRTPAAERPAYACWSCGGRDVTSGDPVPGDPHELGHRALRDRRNWRRDR